MVHLGMRALTSTVDPTVLGIPLLVHLRPPAAALASIRVKSAAVRWVRAPLAAASSQVLHAVLRETLACMLAAAGTVRHLRASLPMAALTRRPQASANLDLLFQCPQRRRMFSGLAIRCHWA